MKCLKMFFYPKEKIQLCSIKALFAIVILLISGLSMSCDAFALSIETGLSIVTTPIFQRPSSSMIAQSGRCTPEGDRCMLGSAQRCWQAGIPPGEPMEKCIRASWEACRKRFCPNMPPALRDN